MDSALLDLILITLPLPELRKVAENHQKQLVLIINLLPYREIHSFLSHHIRPNQMIE